MNRSSQAQTLSDNFIDSRRLITVLRHALDVSYERVLEAGRERWERCFEENDPSNACVSVRVTSGDSERPSLPCAGILRRRRESLLSGSGRPSLA
jgi:hypothetical protein